MSATVQGTNSFYEAGASYSQVTDINVSISPNNSITDPVSWQTALLGLVPLALNAMTQPSSLDFNVPESSLLFPARSSPFVCIADTLEVTIALCIYMYQEGNIYEAARLVNWRIARARLGSGVSELEASPAEQHPVAFWFWFLATLFQAIKLLGMQGVPWTKVWVAFYLCSYIILAIVRSMASKDWRDRPPRVSPLGETHLFQEKVLGITRIVLLVAAIIVHISVSWWALSPKLDKYGEKYNGSSSVVLDLFSLFWILYFMVTTILLVSWLPWVLYRHLIGMNIRLHIGEPDFTSASVLQLIPILGFAFLFYILLSEPINQVFAVFTIIEGGSTLMLYFGVLFLLFTVISFISKRVSFLSFLKFDDGDYKGLLVFPFLNFLVALHYYRNVYDPTGTAKPSWTEQLG